MRVAVFLLVAYNVVFVRGEVRGCVIYFEGYLGWGSWHGIRTWDSVVPVFGDYCIGMGVGFLFGGAALRSKPARLSCVNWETNLWCYEVLNTVQRSRRTLRLRI